MFLWPPIIELGLLQSSTARSLLANVAPKTSIPFSELSHELIVDIYSCGVRACSHKEERGCCGGSCRFPSFIILHEDWTLGLHRTLNFAMMFYCPRSFIALKRSRCSSRYTAQGWPTHGFSRMFSKENSAIRQNLVSLRTRVYLNRFCPRLDSMKSQTKTQRTKIKRKGLLEALTAPSLSCISMRCTKV